jgi:hypothetical protein
MFPEQPERVGLYYCSAEVSFDSSVYTFILSRSSIDTPGITGGAMPSGEYRCSIALKG